MWRVIYLLFILALYWGLRLIFKEASSPIGRFFHKKFYKSAYSNCVLSYITLQVPLAFSATIVFLDTQLNVRYKLINWIVAIVFLFICAIAPFIHFCFLR
jgi:hypothetical protein